MGLDERFTAYSHILCSTDFWNSSPLRAPADSNSVGTSSGSIWTTTPALANFPLRAELDIPFMTMVSGSVADGTSTPPGHMQKEKTPLSSTCWVNEYSAAGIPGSQRPWYRASLIRAWECSTRTPMAKPLASSRQSLARSISYISFAE